MPKLSVTVITKDEAHNLPDALASVAWADEIVIVDSGSEDGTTDVARRFTDRVTVRPWAGYGDQKNHAAGLASHDWILSIDADERVSPSLA
ncbi:MAG: glycosyltransferase family 2 protein, partial [Vicinamibacterales bacterium]|nr:glycosyltransferase family 2 protein [Vicinamibacterales bacterium]